MQCTQSDSFVSCTNKAPHLPVPAVVDGVVVVVVVVSVVVVADGVVVVSVAVVSTQSIRRKHGTS